MMNSPKQDTTGPHSTVGGGVAWVVRRCGFGEQTLEATKRMRRLHRQLQEERRLVEESKPTKTLVGRLASHLLPAPMRLPRNVQVMILPATYDAALLQRLGINFDLKAVRKCKRNGEECGMLR